MPTISDCLRLVDCAHQSWRIATNPPDGPPPNIDTSSTPADAPITYFDAGELGCATGLTTEFRRRIQSVELGGLLEVVVHDPSAKVDLPSLARMMGHRVRSTESRDDGAGVLLIERAR